MTCLDSPHGDEFWELDKLMLDLTPGVTGSNLRNIIRRDHIYYVQALHNWEPPLPQIHLPTVHLLRHVQPEEQLRNVKDVKEGLGLTYCSSLLEPKQ
jgi:hypothetical protein